MRVQGRRAQTVLWAPWLVAAGGVGREDSTQSLGSSGGHLSQAGVLEERRDPGSRGPVMG